MALAMRTLTAVATKTSMTVLVAMSMMTIVVAMLMMAIGGEGRGNGAMIHAAIYSQAPTVGTMLQRRRCHVHDWGAAASPASPAARCPSRPPLAAFSLPGRRIAGCPASPPPAPSRPFAGGVHLAGAGAGAYG